MNRPTCYTCPFFAHLDEPTNINGLCMKNPPTTDGRPETRADLWCGEHPQAVAFVTSFFPPKE